MFLIIFAALIAAGETAKLDRTYLPPVSAATAGGSPGSLQLPFSRSNEGSQGRQDIPTGGFVNDHQGIVVEAALAGTRASGPQSGLGGPRNTYGSSDSKVGDAAFRVQTNQFPQGPTGSNEEPDLSAFHRPPSRKPGNIQIIRDYVSNTINYQNNIGLDKFNYAFETDNGIKMAEKGISRNGVQAQGGFSYTGDDGKVYSVVYTADKNGFRPTGNHLPTPPPIPAEILESLKQNARDEAAGLIDDGSYDAKKYNTEDDYAENDANDKYNDRQSNKFGDRPAFVGGFINQNQQAFVAPNFNGQFGFNDPSKDSTFSKPESSKFGSFGPQTGNRFGSIREPSKDNVNNLFNSKQQQVVNQFPGFTNSANFNVQGKPLSQQKLQDQKPFPERPSFNRPSSYDTSNLGILSSNVGTSQPNVNSFSISNQPISNSFGNGNNKPSGQAFQNKPAQGSFGFNTLNQGVSNDQNLNNNKQFSPQSSLSSTFTSSQPSSGYFTSQPTQQFPSSKIQSSQNSRLPSSQFSSSPVSANSNGASEISNQAVSTTPLRPITPTKQPQTTLTTPLESFGAINADESLSQTDNNNKDRLATDLYNLDNRFSGIQTTQSIENNNSQTGQVSTSFNKPTNAQFSQPQAPDHSYIYNRPNKPFNTPISRPGFISTSGPTSQETASLLSQSSIFTNAPEAPLQNNDVTGINIYPQSPDSSSIKGKENDYQSSRVTQASFPSIVSGVSSQLNGKPSQQLSVNMPSASAFSQISPTLTTATAQASSIPNSETLSTQGIEDLQSQDVNTNIPSQQNTEEVYQYPKPTEGLPSKESAQSDKGNTASKDSSSPQFNAFGTRRPINQQSSFGLQPQFGQGSFNNKGSVVPPFPTNTQQNKPQSPQFGQNIATSSKQPNQSFSFRPQSQQQFNVNTASRFSSKPFTSVPSFSQSTSSGFTNPNTFSQTGQHSSYKPTEQPATQSNFDNKGTTFSQIQGSRQPSFPPFNKPSFGFNTQNPVFQFGQQSLSSSKRPVTERIEQIGKEPISPVTSQSPSIVSKFEDKPSSVGGQFGQIGGQTSKKPFSQTSSFGVQDTTKFNQGTFGSEESTMPEESGDSFDSKLSTLLPSTVQPQTSSFDTQRPVSQFGQSSFSISSLKPSSQSQFGSQQGITSFGQGSFNNKETTTSQFDQSTQQFGSQFENKPSTPNPSSSQTQFDNRKTTNNQFNVPTTNFDQFISTNQPSQPSEQMTTQFGYDNDSKTTTNAKFDIKQQATNSNEPSTLISSTSETQTPTQNSDFGQIYDYTKPSQGFVTPSQQQDKQPFQSNTQFGQQSFLNVQKEKPAQFTQPSFNFATSQFTVTNDDKTESVTQKNTLTGFPSTQSFSPTSQNFDQNTGTIYEYNKPDNRFGQQDSSSVQKEKPAQFTKPSFNFPSSQFSTNEDKTESVTQQNTLAGFPSTQDAFSSTSQNSDQNTGTIYEYNKPDNRFGQQGSLSVQKEKPAQFTKPSFNFASSQFSTNEDKTESVTQQNTLAGFPSTQEDFSSTSQNSDQSTGTIFEYNKPDNRFGQQGSLSVQKENPTQFTKPLFNFPNSQFSTNEDKTESVTQQNTLAGFPSTQNAFSSTSQNSDQSTGSVFEYNTPNNRFGQQEPSNVQKDKPIQFTKPLFNFPNPQFSTSEDKTESVTQQNTLAGFPSTQDVFSSTSQNSDQNTGSVFEYNTPNNRFGQQESSTAQKEKPAQFTQPSFNFGNSQFSTNEDKTESVTQQNTLTGFPSTQDAFSTSQNSDKSSGEIYEYNRPEQSLSTSSDTDRTTQFGQKPQSTSDGNEDSFSTNQQTTPQFGQTTFNFQNTQKTDDLTSTTSLETEKRPQLAFHSACCGGSIFKRPLSANSNPSLNIFNQKESSGQKEGQNDQKDREPEKASSFAGIGEKFPSSRQPPSFDENGYHY